MIRALALAVLPALLATPLLTGCGGAPDAAPPAQPVGAMPHSAVTLDIQPQALLDGLDELHARMGGELGPISDAWTRVEQGLSDAISSLLPSRSSQPTLLAEWGIDAAQSMRFSVAAPAASAMGKALMQRLSGETPTLPDVVVQARLELGVTAPDRLMEALSVLTARVGLDAHRVGREKRPAWIGAEPLPNALRWIGRDPQTGTWIALRVWPSADGAADGAPARAALDVLMPPKPGQVSALSDGLRRTDTGKLSRPPSPMLVPLSLRMWPAEMAVLETAVTAHTGLRHGQAEIGEAAADVLTACISRWRESAEHATSIDMVLKMEDGRPVILAAARLTPAGEAAWIRAERPAPQSVWGLAAWRLRWHSPSFGGGVDPTWTRETLKCVGGDVGAAVPAALPILPRVLPPRAMPMPPLLTAIPWTRIDAAAAAIVDVATLDGEATPVLTGVLLGEGPRPTAPLGEDAVEVLRDGETQWRAVGAPVAIGHRPGRLRVGLGPEALRVVDAPRATSAFDAIIDAAGLAERLTAAGGASAEVRALAAVGERFGQLRASVTRMGAHVIVHAYFKPPPPNP